MVARESGVEVHDCDLRALELSLELVRETGLYLFEGLAGRGRRRGPLDRSIQRRGVEESAFEDGRR